MPGSVLAAGDAEVEKACFLPLGTQNPVGKREKQKHQSMTSAAAKVNAGATGACAI